MIKAILLFLFSLNLWANQTLYPSLTYTSGKGNYRLSSGLSFFSTSALIQENGEKQELSDGESFSFMNIDATVFYGLSDDLDIYAGLRMRRFSADYLINGVSFTTSGLELESFLLGGKYNFYKSQTTNFAIESTFRKAVYENNSYTNFSDLPNEEVALGDDGTEITFAVTGDHYINKNVFFHGLFGYRIPGNDLSEELPYQLEAVMRKKNVAYSFGTNGSISMSSDKYEVSPSSRPFQSRAPTYSFNTVNPTVHRLGGGVTFMAGAWQFGGRFDYVYSGSNTDAGTIFGLNLSYIPKKKHSQKKRRDEFQNYDVEAEVVKVSSQGNFIRINKGLTDGVVKGLRFDIYRTDLRSLNELVAEAVVYKVSSGGAILKVTNRFLRKRIKYGFVARARL